MGKEWVYHFGGNRNKSSSAKKSSPSRGQVKDSSSTSTSSSSMSFSGCMNAILQIFDLHQLLRFPTVPHSPKTHSSSSSFSNPPDDFFLPHNLLQPPTHLKGFEAPRNSLEMDNSSLIGAPSSVLSNATTKLQDTFKTPMGGIKIKTNGHVRSKTNLQELSSSECVNRISSSSSNSPAGTNTPTLVARLMGLDLLPETSSPRPSSSSSSLSNLSSSKLQRQNPRKNDDVIMGSHSLPNTPRTSSARRSSSDYNVVDQQRYSLQINKENSNNDHMGCSSQEFEFSKFLTNKMAADRRKGDENMSPSHYAKQIVQQFKENVSKRRVGQDITNTIENRSSEQRRDQHVVLLKSKKPPSSNLGHYHDHNDNDDKSTTSNSCSPRLSFLEIKHKISHSPKVSASPLPPLIVGTAQSRTAAVRTSSTPKPQLLVPLKPDVQQQNSVPKCKKIDDSEKPCGAELKKPSSSILSKIKEESFVRPLSATRSTRTNAINLSAKKISKQSQLSNVPTFHPAKKDPSPKQKGKQRQQHKQPSRVFNDDLLPKMSRPGGLSQPYNHQESTAVNIPVTNINSNGGTSTTVATDKLIDYISIILECTGIHKFTPISFTNWYSPSHPLHPSLIHHIRLSFPILEIYDKKLVFDVVDQLLAQILRPYLSCNPSWVRNEQLVLMYGWQLIDTLYKRIVQNLPSSGCGTLEDIDALIDKDLSSGRESSAFEEESDGLVMEIEGDLLDTLVLEMVVAMLPPVVGVRTR